MWQVTTAASELDVLIPGAAGAVSQSYEVWKGGTCARRCDGVTEAITAKPCVCKVLGQEGPDRDCEVVTRFRVILPRVPGRAENFLVVALRVANLARAVGYWRDVLGMREVPLPPGLESHGPNGVLNPSTVLSFGEDGEQAMLQLVEVQDGQAVDHALSSGRIAFACKAVAPIHAAAVAAGEKVLTPPLRLPTPGKADVVVTILADRDNYEICFVEGT
jgi:catechol 2,3-dioxygenase-like lactoylglutathione lyase family enzyme